MVMDRLELRPMGTGRQIALFHRMSRKRALRTPSTTNPASAPSPPPARLFSPSSASLIFSRTYGLYSSHANTTYQLDNSAYPGVLRNGNVIFFAHALDRLFNSNGVRLHRELPARDQLFNSFFAIQPKKI
jgi:hypothetical protein